MADKKLMRINEFCHLGNLDNYRGELQDLFDEIEKNECSISGRSNSNLSMHEFCEDGSCRIRISLPGKYDAPLEILWCIFHEYGHHLSGKSTCLHLDRKETLRREELAWDYAERLLERYPRLLSQKQSFLQYKAASLVTYQLVRYDTNREI